MAALGNTLDRLSTITPLGAGATWTSQPVLLGQYNSLTIMVKTDSASSLYVDWSGDNGLNFDATDTYSIVSTVTKRVILTTQQAVARLRLVDGGSGASYLRLFTYGVTTNSSTLTTLVSNIQGQLASINVSNLYKSLGKEELPVSSVIPIVEYNFQYSTLSVNCVSNALKTGYSDLWTGSAGTGASLCGGVNSLNSHYIWVKPGSIIGDQGIIQGRGVRSRAFVTMSAKFTASFQVSNSTVGSLLVGCATPLGNTAFGVGSPTSFMGCVGWNNLSALKTNDNFSLLSASGAVVRTSWNLDKCDGTGTLPTIDFTDVVKPNAFMIEYMPSGNLRFSILSPSTSLWVPVHYIENLNSAWVDFSGEGAFTMFAAQADNPSSGTDECRCSTYSLTVDAPVQVNTALPGSIRMVGSPSSGAVAMASFRMAQQNGSGTNFYTPIALSTLSISCSGGATATVSVEMYLDTTVTGGSWANAHPLIPISMNTTGTVSGATNIVYSFELSPTDSKVIKFDPQTPFLYGFRTVSFLARSPGSNSVSASITVSML